MSEFSNTDKLNDMIDEFIHNYASIFRDVVKESMRNDIQKLVDEAKKEVRDANNKSSLSDDFKSSLDDFLFEPTNGFLR